MYTPVLFGPRKMCFHLKIPDVHLKITIDQVNLVWPTYYALQWSMIKIIFGTTPFFWHKKGTLVKFQDGRNFYK